MASSSSSSSSQKQGKKQTTLFQTWGYEGNRAAASPSQSNSARINTSNSEHASNSAASNAFPADDNDEDEEAFLKEALEIRSGHVCCKYKVKVD